MLVLKKKVTCKLKHKNGPTVVEKSGQGAKVGMNKRSWGLINARTTNEVTDGDYFLPGEAFKSIY